MNTDREKKTFEIPVRESNKTNSISIAENTKTPLITRSPIISFSKRKKRFPFSFRKLIIPICILFIAWLLLSVYTEKRLAPKILELAQARAEKHLLETVNEAVAEMAENGDVRYDNMVKTIRDEKGEVIYLEVDTAMLAGAKAKLVEKIDRNLEENKKITLSVPLGSLSGWNLFSGLGIPIRVRIYPIGMAEGEIFTELEDCGINQTRHLIQVKIHAKMLIVLSGENAEVETEVVLPLGERVLVGDVPEIYLDTLGVG